MSRCIDFLFIKMATFQGFKMSQNVKSEGIITGDTTKYLSEDSENVTANDSRKVGMQ